MSLKVSKRILPKMVFGIIGVFIFFIGALSGFPIPNFVALYVLFLSIYLAWWSKDNCLFLIMFAVLAYSNYSIAFSEYVVVKANTLFTRYVGTYEANVGIYIMLLFWSVLMFVLPASVPAFTSSSYKDYWRTDKKSSIQFVYALALNVLLVLIWIFGFIRPTEIGERGAPSAIYDYSIIFFILCYYFAGKFISIKISTTVILMLYVLQNFVFGGRITGLQVLILFYLMCMEEKYSLKKILPIIVGLFVVLFFIGAYRGNWLRTGFSLSNVWEALKDNLFTLDTAYSSYHTSLTFLLYGEGVSTSVKMGVFSNFLKSIILGGYGTAENSVAHLTANFYAHYNGGVLPFFFYFFMGWPGVILIALYVSIFVRQLTKIPADTTGLKKCLLIYFVTSAFRWYLYSPIQLTRGVLLMVLAFVLSDLGIKALSKSGGGTEEEYLVDYYPSFAHNLQLAGGAA